MSTLSRKFIEKAKIGELREIASTSNLTIKIGDDTFFLSSLAKWMRKSELKEYFLGSPHEKDIDNPSWFDLFCEVRKSGWAISDHVDKKLLKDLSNKHHSLVQIPLIEVYSLSPSAFSLRTLAAKLGYVHISEKNLRTSYYCEMLGFPTLFLDTN